MKTNWNEGSAESLHAAKSRQINSQSYQTPRIKQTKLPTTVQVKHSTASSSESRCSLIVNRDDPQLTINIMYTQYKILYDVATECNMRACTEEEDDWDIWYIDNIATPQLLQKMKNYQRTNHFPGIQVMARKNLLAKNLLAMQKYYPKEFQFFPKTWLLPSDMKSFKEQFNVRKAKTFIIKPEASCQGKGIFLTRNFDWFNPAEHYVAQRYLHKPFLIDGLKFDLRVYVNITSVNPLRIFIYKEGLARFATSRYNSPVGSNLNNLFMHLTNYAINKDAQNFKQNSGQDDVGHKRSMTSIFKHMDLAHEQGNNVTSGTECWSQIKELTVKTVIACYSQVASIYRVNKPHDLESSLCHQVLGFDIFIDIKGKPWLIEVNQSPSFNTDSPLDEKVKKGVLSDSIKMLGLSWERRQKYIAQNKEEAQNRLIGGPRMNNKNKELLRAQYLQQKDKHELKYRGDYERIYPLMQDAEDKELQNLYDKLIEASNAVWRESSAGGGVCAKQKIEELESKDKQKSNNNKLTFTPKTVKSKSTFNAAVVTQRSVMSKKELTQMTPSPGIEYSEFQQLANFQSPEQSLKNTVCQPIEFAQEFYMRYPKKITKFTPSEINIQQQVQVVPKFYAFQLELMPKLSAVDPLGKFLKSSQNANILVPLSQRQAPNLIQQQFNTIRIKKVKTAHISPESGPGRDLGLMVTAQKPQQIVRTESMQDLMPQQLQVEHLFKYHPTKLNTNKQEQATLTQNMRQIVQSKRNNPSLTQFDAFKNYKDRMSKAINYAEPYLQTLPPPTIDAKITTEIQLKLGQGLSLAKSNARPQQVKPQNKPVHSQN